MRRVLVLGASGHIGQLACAAIAQAGDVNLSRAGRSGPIVVDATRPDTFGNVQGFDILVNCADSSTAPPSALAGYCLNHGVHFIETSANPAIYRELRRLDVTGATSSVVLGGGIFPGLSTMAAAELADAEQIDVWVEWSAISGAGPGTVEVMIDALSTPVYYGAEGELQQEIPLSTWRAIPQWGRRTDGIRLGMPDPVILLEAKLASSTSFWAVLKPRLPRLVMRLGRLMSRLGVLRWRLTKALARITLRFVRGRMLRHRATPIRLLAQAPNRFVSITATDAFALSSTTLAAQVALMPLDLREICLPHQTVSVDQVIAYAQSRQLPSAAVERGPQ